MKDEVKSAPAAALTLKLKKGAVLKTNRQIGILRYSPCGRYLVAGGSDGQVRRWETSGDSPRELPALEGHDGWVQAIAFHPDGDRLFTADSWGKLIAWPFTLEHPEPLWTAERVHDGWIRALAVSPDGKRLATAGRDGKVRLGSTDSARDPQTLTGHEDDIFTLAFHPDGHSLVSGDFKGVVRQWDLDTGAHARTLDAGILYRLDRLQDVGGARVLTFDREGKVLACAGMQPKGGGNVQGVPTVLLFDWVSGKVTHTLKVGNDGDGFVFDLYVHPDGFVIAVTSGNPGVGKLFCQVPGAEAPFALETSMANCHSLAVHPEGRSLVVAATNANSNGNGRQIGKGTEYPGNWSPLHFWELVGPSS